MHTTEVIIIGGGQAGLAMSHRLCAREVEHVVLERGLAGERWRRASWDSLRLLTPNWLSRLPGYRHAGTDPDAFIGWRELVAHLEGYRCHFDAPLLTRTTVGSVRQQGERYEVETERGTWRARAVVIATGACGTPWLPEQAGHLDSRFEQLTLDRYRRPDQLSPGGVLVVGASASGLQLAGEIRASGRHVSLAVGRHVRMPRTYRGHDIFRWLDRLGILDQGYRQHRRLEAARRSPSLQLVGRRDAFDLGVAARRGVRLLGRLTGAGGSTVRFAGDLAESLARADARLADLLERIDRFIDRRRLAAPPAERPPTIQVPEAPTELDLAAEGISTVIWATGFKPRYDWLKVPVLDPCGRLRHDGGVLPTPGLYALGLPFLRRRKSPFLDGVGPDAEELSAHLVRYLASRPGRPRPIGAAP